MNYEVRYENGSSNTLQTGLADSLQEAVEASQQGILSCLPKGFNPDNMVRPTIARRLDSCALCGIGPDNLKQTPYSLRTVPCEIWHQYHICDICIDAVQKYRREVGGEK